MGSAAMGGTLGPSFPNNESSIKLLLTKSLRRRYSSDTSEVLKVYDGWRLCMSWPSWLNGLIIQSG